MVQEGFQFSLTGIDSNEKNINSKGKILIIDDVEMNLTLLEEILSNEDMLLKTTSDSRKVMKIAAEFTPDVILLDLIMPDVDGFSLLKQLKTKSETKFSEVIIVTARSNPQDIGKAYELGAYDYIKKPYDSVELLIRVNGALKLKKTLDEQRVIKKQLEIMNKSLLDQKKKLQGENLELKGKLTEFQGKFEPQTADIESGSILKSGYIYIYYENKPDKCIKLFVNHLHRKFIGLMITRRYPEEIKKEYQIINTPIFWVNSVLKGFENNAIGPQQIQEIIYLAKNFLKNNSNTQGDKYKKIIFLDGIEILITYNTFNTFLRFLSTLYDLAKIYNCIILISADMNAFDKKEKALLERELVFVDTTKK
jgi:DNA-binding response OmpR family regulator